MALLSGATYTPAQSISHERKAFLAGVDGIESGNTRLKQSKNQLYQSEAIGHDILSDLQNQREIIGRGREMFAEQEDLHGNIDGKLQSMGFNQTLNKYMCWIIVFLLVA
eukprot:CAMPEP_0118955324 /NCGR_PEP_ID=MMETSP1169-20130426/59789_1 /TAXON_ID=36882 /ORGANISM="Pyramimonas obovata, Strain CCMP722" /LENGTH=108 /DNA_ID=CAMNT_0006903147 /DNA_START=396 /DNA_END=718 /DNA_ORIENTATION=-